MTASRLHRTIADYRARLLANEAKAAQTLNDAHAHTLAAIQPALDKLYREIAEKQQSGETIPLSWLYEQRRLQAIKRLITNQIDHYGALALMQTGQLQSQSAQLGQQAGMDLLDATVPPGVNFSFGVPSPKAIVDIVGATQAGSPLADLFNGFGTEAADKAGKALITGVTLGQNPRQTALAVQDALGISRSRALTIARTESLRAYRSANLETFKANSDVVSEWVWQSALDARTCVACIAMNGSVHGLDEEMGSHPCCRCVMSPRTKSWDEILGPLDISSDGISDIRPDIQSGEDWLNDQDEAVQRKVLGPLYAGWQNGDFALKDVVKRSHDKDWGGSISVKPLKDLVK